MLSIIEPTNKLKKEYKITVCVLTYNSEINKLFATLDSILEQEKVSLEIVIADDGSKENLQNEIIEYFKLHDFTDYVIAIKDKNEGTVINTYNALKCAKGEYVKAISPGDRLYGKDILQRWIAFVEKNNYAWSFSDAIYYKLGKDKEIIPVVTYAYPNNTEVYKKSTFDEQRWYYLVLNEFALGATMICKRDIQINYCEQIINKVVYAEDHIWRLMMFDGVKGGFFNEYSILYEYGSGISTSSNSKWRDLIKKDWDTADNIILSREPQDSFQNKIQKAMFSNVNKKINRVFIRGKLKNKIRTIIIGKRKTINFLPPEGK